MIREPVVAGTFYPDSPDIITKDINRYINSASIINTGNPIGFVVPHAGYLYSGPVAAFSYKHIIGKKFKRVVILAPSHFDGFEGISIYSGDGLSTPLGVVDIDVDSRQMLINEGLVTSSDIGFGQEHSIEVQLPFLQTTLKTGWKIIPLVMGFQYQETIDNAATILKKFIDEKSLIIISSDLSHYHSYDDAKEIDSRFCAYINSGDIKGLWDAYVDKRVEACGFGEIYAFLKAVRNIDDLTIEVLDCRNSGDTSGFKDQVVGYVAIGCFRKRTK